MMTFGQNLHKKQAKHTCNHDADVMLCFLYLFDIDVDGGKKSGQPDKHSFDTQR